MKPCWSCGALNRPCYAECDCAKCVDPEGYEEFKRENPEAYREYLEDQKSDREWTDEERDAYDHRGW